MSAVETGQMSAAATGQMSSAETRQMSTGKTGRCPVSLFYMHNSLHELILSIIAFVYMVVYVQGATDEQA